MSEIIDPNSFLSKQRNAIETKYIIKKFRDNPDKFVDYLQIVKKNWDPLRGGIPNKDYESSAISDFYQKYKKEIGYLNSAAELADLVGSKQVAGGAKVFIIASELMEKYSVNEIENRKKIGQELFSDTQVVESIFQMLEERPKWNQALGEMVRSKDGYLDKIALEILKKEADFFGKDGLNIPQKTEDLIRGLDPYDQTLYANEKLKEFLKAEYSNTEQYVYKNNKITKEQVDNIEKELKDLSDNQDELNKKFSDFLKEQLTKEKLQALEYQREFQYNEYKGYGKLIGLIIGINNPKLGNAITQGSAAIVDAYKSFNTIATIGMSAATMATGVGSVMAVMSIIQAFNQEEDNSMQLLFEGLNKINESINDLKNTVNEKFAITFEKLDKIIYEITNNKENLKELFNETNRLIKVYGDRILEANFETKMIELQNLYNDFSTGDDYTKVLNKVYSIAINDSSSEIFTRRNDSIDELYNYLNLYTTGQNDGFKWPPLEFRPVLLDMILKDFTKVSKIEVFKNENQTIYKEELSKFKIIHFYVEDNTVPKNEGMKFKFPLPEFWPYDWQPKKFEVPLYYKKFAGAKVELIEQEGFIIQLSLINEDDVFFVSPVLQNFSFKLQDWIVSNQMSKKIALNQFEKEIEYVNPHITSLGTKIFNELLISGLNVQKLLLNNTYQIPNKINNLQKFENLLNTNLWFSSSISVLSNESILSYYLNKYLSSTSELQLYIIENTNFDTDYLTNLESKNNYYNLFNNSLSINNSLYINNKYKYSIDSNTLKDVDYNQYLNSAKNRINKILNSLLNISGSDLKCYHIEDNIMGKLKKDEENLGQDAKVDTYYWGNEVTGISKFKLYINNLEIPYEIYFADKRKVNVDIFSQNMPPLTAWLSASKMWRFINIIGTGTVRLSIADPGNQNARGKFVKSFFQEDLIERLYNVKNRNDIIGDFIGSDVGQLNIFINEFKVVNYFDSIDFEYLKELILEVKQNWINLSTSLLCYCNKNKDFRAYETLLLNKPKLLSEIPLRDDTLFENIIGQELEKIYLLPFIFSDKIKTVGLQIINKPEVETEKNENLNIYYTKNEGVNKFEVSSGLKNKVLTKMMKINENPLVFPSITQNIDEAIESSNKIVDFLYYPYGVE